MTMSRIAYLGVVALTVAGASACATTVAPSPATPTADVSTVPFQPAEESPPAAPALDLASVILAPDAAPSGVRNDTVVEGTPVLTRVVISGRDLEFLALSGFAAGRYSQFSGEGGLLLSLGLLFDTTADAERALALFLVELRSDKGYRVGSGGAEVGLGDGGTCAEFDNPALGGLQESACLWRHGTLVLLTGGTLGPEAIQAIAEGMDDGAASAYEP